MSRNFMICSGIIFGLLLTLPISVVADSWKETFDTSTLDNWEIKYGNWYVDNGILTVNETSSVGGSEGESTSIWHSQTQMTGSWSFDIMHTGEEDFGTLFYFIGTGVTGDQLHPTDGYVIHIWGNGNIDLDYVAGCCYQYSPGNYTGTGPLSGWQHILVSRSIEGDMVVFLNDIEIIRSNHDLVPASENINIQTETLGVKFDNISYTDEIQISSNSKEDETSIKILFGWFGLIVTTFALRKIKSPKKKSFNV